MSPNHRKDYTLGHGTRNRLPGTQQVISQKRWSSGSPTSQKIREPWNPSFRWWSNRAWGRHRLVHPVGIPKRAHTTRV